ncbi:MAG: HNH endonuclease [Desulfurellales bacterium]|nr:MAG: HNH endonuclease [Desulfurellales bacterium]
MSKEIQLTKGFTTIVDDDDYEWLSQWQWHAHQSRRDWYACRSQAVDGGGQITVRMHRLILGAPDGMVVDHINRNSLDNRRSNLRIATRTENLRNGRSPSGWRYPKGVRLIEGHWIAYVCLGRFDTKEQAAAAYDEAAKTLWGEQVYLNKRDKR